jgi:monoamine oxidase
VLRDKNQRNGPESEITMLGRLEPSECIARLEERSRRVAKQDVVVLGAGIGGLVAGYELSRLGHRVRIFEASNRVGGRIYTKNLSESGEPLYAELGAMRIPRAHRLTRHYVRTLGLEGRLQKFDTVLQNENCFVELNGLVCRVKDAVQRFSEEFETIADYRSASPYTRNFATGLKILVDAVSPHEIRESFAHDLRSGALAAIDQILAGEVFPMVPAEITPRSVVNYLPKLQHLWSPSVATFMRDVALETASELDHLEGGMDQLPRALARRVAGEIRLNAPVAAICIARQGVFVRFADGQKILADHVICTIPFTVMRELELVGFSPEKREVIRRMKYHDACKIFLVCRERFWEREPYQIFGGASISDQKFRQVYYPPRQAGAQRGVLLASYVIGDESKKLSKLDPERAGAELVEMISRLHPELSEPGMVERVVSFSWGKQEWMRGGCSVTYRSRSEELAGDVSSRRSLEHAVAARPEGGLYLAGEHCSDDRAWIEGAVSSALEQVSALLENAGRSRHGGYEHADS